MLPYYECSRPYYNGYYNGWGIWNTCSWWWTNFWNRIWYGYGYYGNYAGYEGYGYGDATIRTIAILGTFWAAILIVNYYTNLQRRYDYYGYYGSGYSPRLYNRKWIYSGARYRRPSRYFDDYSDSVGFRDEDMYDYYAPYSGFNSSGIRQSLISNNTVCDVDGCDGSCVDGGYSYSGDPL